MTTISIEDKNIIQEIIKKSQICHVGMIDVEGLPYVIPMNFGFDGETIYLHSGNEGRSIESLEKNPQVCITFCTAPKLKYQSEEVACSYTMQGSSVICRGKISFEENYDEKVRIMNIIMKQYTDKSFTYSEPAIKHVRIWKVEMEDMSMRVFGAPNPKSPRYQTPDYTQY